MLQKASHFNLPFCRKCTSRQNPRHVAARCTLALRSDRQRFSKVKRSGRQGHGTWDKIHTDKQKILPDYTIILYIFRFYPEHFSIPGLAFSARQAKDFTRSGVKNVENLGLSLPRGGARHSEMAGKGFDYAAPCWHVCHCGPGGSIGGQRPSKCGQRAHTGSATLFRGTSSPGTAGDGTTQDELSLQAALCI